MNDDEYVGEKRQEAAGKAFQEAARQHAEAVNSGEKNPGGVAVDRDEDDPDDEGGLEDVPARSLAFDAVVRTAIDRAGESSSWSRRFGTGRVERALEGEASTRTVRRAMKDAEALGWVTKGYGDWRPGERAEALRPDRDEDGAASGQI